MRLESFQVKNFRSIIELKLESLSKLPILTFVGSLSSGKSNILRSLELFWNPTVLEEERQMVLERKFYNELQGIQSKATTIEGSWVFEVGDLTQTLGLFYGTPVEELVADKNPQQILVKLTYDLEDGNHPKRYLGLVGRDDKIQWLGSNPYDPYLEEVHQALGSRLIYRFRGDWDLDVEKFLVELCDKPSEKTRYEALLARLLGEAAGVELYTKQGTSKPAVVLRMQNGSLMPYVLLSHSMRRLLAMLAILTKSNNHLPDNYPKGTPLQLLPKILLVDSPEIGDPGTQRVLADMFVEHAPPHQILVATQTPRFMLGSIYIVKMVRSHSFVQRADEDQLEEVVGLLGIRPSDSMSADAVVFVEGEADAAVYRLFKEKIFDAYKEQQPRRPPLVSFIPVDGWTKMTFTISVRILKSKYVRTNAFAIVDGDTKKQTRSFKKIKNAFETVFGHKSFLVLKEQCLETIFLNEPEVLAGVLGEDVQLLMVRIQRLRSAGTKDKDIIRQFVREHKDLLGSDIYHTATAVRFAEHFTVEQIPDRVKKLFRKILWSKDH